eukprot:5749170-Alexandrium_andersonii.AAC.1
MSWRAMEIQDPIGISQSGIGATHVAESAYRVLQGADTCRTVSILGVRCKAWRLSVPARARRILRWLALVSQC